MTLAQLLVRLAYRQQASAAYGRFKGFFHKLLTDPRSHRRLLFDSIRRMLSQQVYDVIDATRARIAEHQPADAGFGGGRACLLGR